METPDTYGASHGSRHEADESTPTSPPADTVGVVVPLPVPARPYSKLYHDYVDDAMWLLSGAAWKCLSYLIRHTIGRQRADVRVSLAEMSGDFKTGLSRRAVAMALDELEARHIIRSDADERGRTQVRTFRLRSPDEWILTRETPATSAKNAIVGRKGPDAEEATSAGFAIDEIPTSADFAIVGLVGDDPATETSAKSATTIEPTSAKNAIAGASTSAKIATRSYMKKEKKERKNTTANAVGGAAADAPRAAGVISSSPVNSSAASSMSPKAAEHMTAAERDAHNQRMRYCRLLVEAIEDVNGFPFANHAKELRAAAWFYTASWEHAPVPQEEVVACYRATLIEPKWDGEPPGLHILRDRFGPYQRNPDGYTTAMRRKRTMHERLSDPTRAASAPAAYVQRGASNGSRPANDTAADADPANSATSKYAKFFDGSRNKLARLDGPRSSGAPNGAPSGASSGTPTSAPD